MLRTILVDDEPLALERLAVFFKDIDGAEVVGTARDGREAADVIARLKPDLAILDIQMPEQNGLRVAATLPEKIGPRSSSSPPSSNMPPTHSRSMPPIIS
jgi:two-component system LytT family response regulator